MGDRAGSLVGLMVENGGKHLCLPGAGEIRILPFGEVYADPIGRFNLKRISYGISLTRRRPDKQACP
jgi:hypothetical protein